jgi:hypothetical protein
VVGNVLSLHLVSVVLININMNLISENSREGGWTLTQPPLQRGTLRNINSTTDVI